MVDVELTFVQEDAIMVQEFVSHCARDKQTQEREEEPCLCWEADSMVGQEEKCLVDQKARLNRMSCVLLLETKYVCSGGTRLSCPGKLCDGHHAEQVC